MLKLFQYLAQRGLRLPAEKVFGAMLALHFSAAGGIPMQACGATLLASLHALKEQWKIFIAEYKRNLIGVDNAPWAWPGPPDMTGATLLNPAQFYTVMACIPLRSSNLKANDPFAGAQRQHGGLPGRQKRPMLHIQMQTPRESRGMLDLGNVPFAAAEAAGGGQAAALDLPAAPLALDDTPGLAAEADAAETEAAAEGLQQAAEAEGHEALGIRRRKSLADVTAQLQMAEKGQKADQKAANNDKTASMKNEQKKQPMKKKKPKKKKSKQLLKLGSADAASSATKPKVAKPKEAKSSVTKAKVAKPKGAKSSEIKAKVAKSSPSVASSLPMESAAPDPKPGKKLPPSEDIRQKMRSGSPKTRKRLHWKYGCAKCVWKPQCTNSCWKQRKMTVPSAAELGSDVE
jgi:hypothetical protein